MLKAYSDGVSEKERAEFEEWFGVAEVVGQASCLTSPTGFQPVVDRSESSTTGKMPVGRDTRDAYPPHIVSATLFWKHVNAADPDLPPPTRETLVDAKLCQRDCVPEPGVDAYLVGVIS